MGNAFEEFFKKNEQIPTESDNTPIKKDERRLTGRITLVSKDGYGFITSKEIKFRRIFFHWTSLRQDTLNFEELKIGMQVEFTPIDMKEKGWRAIKIKVIQD